MSNHINKRVADLKVGDVLTGRPTFPYSLFAGTVAETRDVQDGKQRYIKLADGYGFRRGINDTVEVVAKLSEAQDRAFAFLNNRFGDCVATDWQNDGSVKLTGIDEDRDARARWYVGEDGRVRNAWDPDGALDVYEDGLRADGLLS